MKSRENLLPRISLQGLSWVKCLCCGADNVCADSHWHLGTIDRAPAVYADRSKRSPPLHFWHCSSLPPAGAVGSFGSVEWEKRK